MPFVILGLTKTLWYSFAEKSPKWVMAMKAPLFRRIFH